MDRITLMAEIRESGKGHAKRIRAAGLVPAILYGKEVKPIAISVNRRELEKAVRTKSGMNVIIDLTVKGSDSGLALIREYQADPFKRDFTHVDFQAISLTDKIEIEVPVVLIGESVGVKEGGVVEQSKRTILVKTLPTSIPEKIELDISALKIGDSLHADDMKLPEGVESAHTVNYTMVTIVPPAKEEVAAPIAAPLEGEAVPAEGEAVPAEGEAVPAEGTAAAPAKGDAKAAPSAAEPKKK